MKKYKILAPVLAASLLLLCGCRASTPAIGLSPNWNKDTTREPDGTDFSPIEELSYDVTFESNAQSAYGVQYETGTYTTKLECRIIHEAEPAQLGYAYTTQLKLTGYFTINGEKSPETFEDVLTSEVLFLRRDKALQPVKSVKKGNSHTPVGTSPKSFEENYFWEIADYVYEVNYNNPLTEATINLSYRDRYSTQTEFREYKAEPQTTAVTATNFFDNEQILFVLRGYNMAGAVSLKTLDPASYKTQATVNITAPSAVSRVVDFTIDENGSERKIEEAIDTYETTMMLSAGMSGQARLLVYAARTQTYQNDYRNVLIYQEVPYFSNLGTMKYSLKTAKFYS